MKRPCASPAGPAGGRPLLPADWDRELPHRVRQHGADGGGGYGGGAPRDEIVATTVGVPVKRLLILVTGTRYQDQLDEISYRIRALDPDLMSDERFDEQVRRLRAGRDRLKALPAEPGRRDSLPAGDLYAGIYQTLPELPRVSRTGNSRLIYAAVPIPSSSSMTSRGVLYPSVE